MLFWFSIPLLFILPLFFGLDGVWYASPAAEYIMLVMVLGMLSKEFKFLRNEKAETDDSGPKSYIRQQEHSNI